MLEGFDWNEVICWGGKGISRDKLEKSSGEEEVSSSPKGEGDEWEEKDGLSE